MERTTLYILVAVTVALALYDVCAVAVGGNKASISRVLLEFSQRYPVIPFLLGLLIGHTIWPNKE